MTAATSAPLTGAPASAEAAPCERPPCTATLAMARLLIHATEGVGTPEGSISAVLRRWRTWAVSVTRADPPGQVRLQIADLQGRAIFSANELQPLIEVPLTAGIYHITVSDGRRQRRYTVALEQGATFNLHLRSAPAVD